MTLVPTEEQLESRNQVKEFLSRVAGPIRSISSTMRSKWFDRPDEELTGWIERGRAINEIKDSLGYRLILTQAEKEIQWAREQLELGTLDDNELRSYLKALRFFKDFILTTEKNADISSSILAGRAGAIARETTAFIKNARTDDASNR